MLITCKCLNIAIDTQGSDVLDIEISSLGLSVSEQNDKFFKQMVYAVEHGRISKVQSTLVQIHNAGSWIIHCCLNCSTNTHAIHRDRGAAVVLFSKTLLTNPEEIAALKCSDRYSPVFRIIINNSEAEVSSLHAPTKFSVSQLPAPVQTALSALQQQLGDVVRQEVAHTEERVRQYSEQQYASLEEFREHAHRDHRALARLLCETQENVSISTVDHPIALDNLETPPSTPDNHNIPKSPLPNPVCTLPRSPASSVQNSPSPLMARQQPSVLDVRKDSCPNPSTPNLVGGTVRSERRLPIRLFDQRRGQGCSLGGSFDAEGLFDLEGMDDNPSEMIHSEEETDTDDSSSHDEGIHIPRSRGLHSNLAKSLPVNVPTFLSPERSGGDETDQEDNKLPQDPMDIAASIKALARSVHGDANVFGDLPRPRFSTQI